MLEIEGYRSVVPNVLYVSDNRFAKESFFIEFSRYQINPKEYELNILGYFIW